VASSVLVALSYLTWTFCPFAHVMLTGTVFALIVPKVAAVQVFVPIYLSGPG
jgi:hypothetical protein